MREERAPYLSHKRRHEHQNEEPRFDNVRRRISGSDGEDGSRYERREDDRQNLGARDNDLSRFARLAEYRRNPNGNAGVVEVGGRSRGTEVPHCRPEKRSRDDDSRSSPSPSLSKRRRSIEGRHSPPYRYASNQNRSRYEDGIPFRANEIDAVQENHQNRIPHAAHAYNQSSPGAHGASRDYGNERCFSKSSNENHRREGPYDRHQPESRNDSCDDSHDKRFAKPGYVSTSRKRNRDLSSFRDDDYALPNGVATRSDHRREEYDTLPDGNGRNSSHVAGRCLHDTPGCDRNARRGYEEGRSGNIFPRAELNDRRPTELERYNSMRNSRARGAGRGDQANRFSNREYNDHRYQSFERPSGDRWRTINDMDLHRPRRNYRGRGRSRGTYNNRNPNMVRQAPHAAKNLDDEITHNEETFKYGFVMYKDESWDPHSNHPEDGEDEFREFFEFRFNGNADEKEIPSHVRALQAVKDIKDNASPPHQSVEQVASKRRENTRDLAVVEVGSISVGQKGTGIGTGFSRNDMNMSTRIQMNELEVQKDSNSDLASSHHTEDTNELEAGDGKRTSNQELGSSHGINNANGLKAGDAKSSCDNKLSSNHGINNANRLNAGDTKRSCNDDLASSHRMKDADGLKAGNVEGPSNNGLTSSHHIINGNGLEARDAKGTSNDELANSDRIHNANELKVEYGKEISNKDGGVEGAGSTHTSK